MNGDRTLSSLGHEDIGDLAFGCALLGSGGGGDIYLISLVLSSLLREGHRIPIIAPDDLDADATVVTVSFVGAPITMQEKLMNGTEIVRALEVMQQRLGRPITAIMSAEIGGGNGLSAFLAGALLNLPVVDGDGMGRAFPLSDQISFAIYGRSALPTVVASEQGEVAVIEAGTNRHVERLVRSLCVAMGSTCFSVDYPMRGLDVHQCAVLNTVSLALGMGTVVREARKEHRSTLEALTRLLEDRHGIALRLLFEGTVVDREYDTRAGFGRGRIQLAKVGETRPSMDIDFQNEFLIARQDGVAIATTPDIISLADPETLLAITTDTVRYGQRVKVIAIEALPAMQSTQALAVVGPRAFGFDMDYRSIATLEAARGVAL